MSALHRRTQPLPASRTPTRSRPTASEAAGLQLLEMPSRRPVAMPGNGAATPAVEGRRRAMAPESVIALQRVHGNARVQRVLLQRDKGNPDDPEVPDESPYPSDLPLPFPLPRFKPPADALFELLDYSGEHAWMERLNDNAKDVLAEMARLLKLDLDWNSDVETVQKHQLTGGAALKRVEGAAKTIGERSRGERGKSYRGDVEGYLDAIREADRQVREIGRMRGELGTAVLDVHTIALGGDKLLARRDVAKNQEDLDAEQKRINETKALIAKFTGFAVSLVDPAKWMSVVVAATVCVGESVIEANVPAGSLERLQQQLTEAKAKLVAIEDAEQVAKMATAAQRVNTAGENLASAKETFLDLFKHIEEKQTTIVETLGRSSATKGAAGAIAERGEVAATAIRAEQRITTYLAESAPLPPKLDPLADRFKYAVDFYLNSPFIKGLPRNVSPAYLTHVGEVSEHNADTLLEYKRYIEQMRVDAQKSLEFLAAGEYMAGYSEIPGAVQNAVIERNAPKQKGSQEP